MKHVCNWIIYCIWNMVFVLACKASFSLLLDHADEILQKSFVVGTTTSIETSSYISETLQLLNLETVQIWMRWQNFTSQLMEQRNHYRRKNKWLQQWDLPDTRPKDSRNEWKKLTCWWNCQWTRLWMWFLHSFYNIPWFALEDVQSCQFSFFCILLLMQVQGTYDFCQ